MTIPAQIEDLDRFVAPSIDWWAVTPQLILIGGALLILLVTSLSPRPLPLAVSTGITVVSAAAAVAVGVKLWFDVRDDGPRSVISGALGLDGFSLFFLILVGLALVLSAFMIDDYAAREGLAGPEMQALILCAAIGAVVMASANDLIVLFLGLETLSIGIYVMAAMHLRRSVSQEAAIKYFVLGAFSSAFFLYGVALIYGATGTTNLALISLELSTTVFGEQGLLYIGMALLLVGLGFKVAAVPFHMWTPDVYQGAPTPVTGYMASVAKAAGFAAILRVFFVTFDVFRTDWRPLVWVLAVLSLVVGTVLAVVQTNVKRMLAYSSISHAGYVLVAVESASDEGTAAALFYLFAYTFMVLGSFAVVAVVARRGDAATELDDYDGLAARRPALALAFTVLLLSQGGVPFTSGFMAKFFVIEAAAEARSWWLAVIAMVMAAVGMYVYLRIVVAMYLRSPAEGDAPAIRVPGGAIATILGAVGITLVFGFLPQFLLDFARDAVPVLVAGGL